MKNKKNNLMFNMDNLERIVRDPLFPEDNPILYNRADRIWKNLYVSSSMYNKDEYDTFIHTDKIDTIEDMIEYAKRIEESLKQNKKTIVYSLKGTSRSPACVMIWLILYKGFPAEKAKEFVASARKCTYLEFKVLLLIDQLQERNSN